MTSGHLYQESFLTWYTALAGKERNKLIISGLGALKNNAQIYLYIWMYLYFTIQQMR